MELEIFEAILLSVKQIQDIWVELSKHGGFDKLEFYCSCDDVTMFIVLAISCVVCLVHCS